MCPAKNLNVKQNKPIKHVFTYLTWDTRNNFNKYLLEALASPKQ